MTVLKKGIAIIIKGADFSKSGYGTLSNPTAPPEPEIPDPDIKPNPEPDPQPDPVKEKIGYITIDQSLPTSNIKITGDVGGEVINQITSKITYQYGKLGADNILQLGYPTGEGNECYLTMPSFWFKAFDVSAEHNRNAGSIWKIGISAGPQDGYFKFDGENKAICLTKQTQLDRRDIDSSIASKMPNHRSLYYEEIQAMQLLRLFQVSDIRSNDYQQIKHYDHVFPFKPTYTELETEIVNKNFADHIHEAFIGNIERKKGTSTFTIKFEDGTTQSFKCPFGNVGVHTTPNDSRVPILSMHFGDRAVFLPKEIKDSKYSNSSQSVGWEATTTLWYTNHEYYNDYDTCAIIGASGNPNNPGMFKGSNMFSFIFYLKKPDNGGYSLAVYKGKINQL